MISCKTSVKFKPILDILTERGLNDGGRCQKRLDAEVLRLCEPYIPLDKKALIQSGISNTIIGSSRIVWDTPYARKWYYQPAKFNEAPKRGNYWFERMKNEGGVAKLTEVVRRSIRK